MLLSAHHPRRGLRHCQPAGQHPKSGCVARLESGAVVLVGVYGRPCGARAGGVPAFDKWCPSWPPTQPALHLCRPPPPAARSLHIYACLPSHVCLCLSSHIYMCVFRPIQFLCFGMLASPLVCPPIVIDVALCGRMTGSRARRPCTGGTESTSQSTSGIRAYLHATTWKG